MSKGLCFLVWYPHHSRNCASVFGMLPSVTTLRIGLGGNVPLSSSVNECTIPLVSSVRIGLASRVLLVQANTGSCVVGEPEWGGRSSAGAV